MANYEVRNIPLENIDLDENTRKNYDVEDLRELSESIRTYGVQQPVLLRTKGDRLSLIFGGRRYRASQMIGRKTIPAIIKEISDDDVVELQIIENLQRTNISPLEEAGALKKVLDLKGYTQEKLAGKIGRSQSWVANRLRLSGAPKELQEMIISRGITPKHAIILLPYVKYPVYKDIVEKLKEDIQENVTVPVRRLENIIRDCIASFGSNGKSVLCLTDFPFDLRKCKRGFSLVTCRTCHDSTEYHIWGDDHLFCLNKECWKAKIKTAQEKIEEKKQAEISKLPNPEPVDISKVDCKDYAYLTEDFPGCEGCEKKRLSGKNFICMNPGCLGKKKGAEEKALQKAAKMEEARIWQAIDDWLITVRLDIDRDLLRFLLNTLINCCWSDSAKKGLSRWGNLKDYNGDREGFLANIPEYEYDQVLVRLMVAIRFTQGGLGASREVLENVLPEVMPYLECEVSE